MVDRSACLELLRAWLLHAERYWYPMPDEPQLGCYGTGYNAWGVQTNQKYLAAMAVLSAFGEADGTVSGELCDRARDRALSALRFSLRSHLSGDYRCTDGTQWGHTWISGLGIERMMHGVTLLEPYMTDQDRGALRAVLTSEADWLLHHHTRGGNQGVFADPWNHSRKNVPESNLWNGAILWRAATMYPDHDHAGEWQEQAHRFLINAISVPADAEDKRQVAGRPIQEWHVGANFFPNYGLDHHGYLNVGYMVICLSNAAMLYFDMRAQGLTVPESLSHHNADLWRVLRRLIFSDGRLARIGGDTRVRYAYCQEYLLPTLVYAADALGERHAPYLIAAQLQMIRREAEFSGDGSFYGRRLAPLAAYSPYYYTRLESDRACGLGMLLTYSRRVRRVSERSSGDGEREAPGAQDFEASVSGAWCEPEHGAVLHRRPTRLASFAWRAQGLAQGMCQPPDDGHLAEWWQNLGGGVRFVSDDAAADGQRRLLGQQIEPFEGGFVTSGSLMEGVGVRLAEGWSAESSAVHQIAIVALPDEHTVLGFQHCRSLDHRSYVAEIKGLHLNLPNDLYNGFTRHLVTAQGALSLESPAERDGVIDLQSRWVNLEGRVGVVGLYGAEGLVVHRSRQRRGGKYRSLYTEQFCWRCELGTQAVDPGQVVLDVGWGVLSAVDAPGTRHFVRQQTAFAWSDAGSSLRGARVEGLDGGHYAAVVNFGPSEAVVEAEVWAGVDRARDLVTGEAIGVGQSQELVVAPGRMRVFLLET